ncbi:hypothetical protein ABZ860_22800 [Microbispora sp. NPDC046973]|uniref:hypothetical protein n=1 Tax=Microbispora sp. NPDC046973 TaxID=3155022 RepID=UPI0033C2EF30
MPVLKGLVTGLALATAISGGALALCVTAASADERDNTSNDWSNDDRNNWQNKNHQWWDNQNWWNQDALSRNKDDASAFGIASKDTAIGSQDKTQRDDVWWNNGWFNNNSWFADQDDRSNKDHNDQWNRDRDFAHENPGIATLRGEDDEPAADVARNVEEQRAPARNVADVEQAAPPVHRQQFAPPSVQQVAPPPMQQVAPARRRTAPAPTAEEAIAALSGRPIRRVTVPPERAPWRPREFMDDMDRWDPFGLTSPGEVLQGMEQVAPQAMPWYVPPQFREPTR